MHNEQENTNHRYYTSLVLYLVMPFSNGDGRVDCTVKKVKRSRYRPGVAQRVGRGIALLFHDRGTRRG